MRAAALLSACALCLVPTTVGAQMTLELFVSGLDSPVAFLADPLDVGTSFVVEQRGVVRVVRDRRLLDTPFIDLGDAISAGGERGLLGLAVEPSAANAGGSIGGRVFVNYTNRQGDTVISRFRRSGSDPMIADVSSRHDLVWPDGRAFIEQPFSNHNGGHLVFGPDGYLYVGLGDGGSGGDPMHLAQDPRSLLGKMLRLDVGVPDDDQRGYRVPADNPFAAEGRVPALAEIWAFGLRNPWRYAFDDPARGGTGALFIGDVGQSQREEVDYQPAGVGGLNYGWRLREGALVFDERRPAAYEPLTAPIHDYDRTVGQAITGGFVYRGAALDPSWYGRYMFADFSAGRVFSLAWRPDTEGRAEASDLREHTESLGGSNRLGLVSSFGTDAAGELYVLNHSAGQVWKIVPDLSLVPLA
ncbi:MAG: PQQ-dependent sugar dehydrogenase, partial [Acidobacteria bacterium]|nr:PQQ-dependent sugar dehydrogenase [Acidobacteriota bacterium]